MNRDIGHFISNRLRRPLFHSSSIPFSGRSGEFSCERGWPGKKETGIRTRKERDSARAPTFYKFATSIVGGRGVVASSGNAPGIPLHSGEIRRATTRDACIRYNRDADDHRGSPLANLTGRFAATKTFTISRICAARTADGNYVSTIMVR